MKINVNGKEVEAYRLIMQKANAKEILDGTKKIEIRDFSATYERMFIDKEKEKQVIERRQKNPDEEFFFEDITRSDVKYIRFTNYSGSWYLDVSLKYITAFELSEEDIKFLNKEFDFHDLDETWQEFKDLPENEKPLMFAIVLDKVENKFNI